MMMLNHTAVANEFRKQALDFPMRFGGGERVDANAAFFGVFQVLTAFSAQQ